MNTVVVGRMMALSRAELTLLVRNKTAMFMALVIPAVLTFGVRSTVDGMDLTGTGLTVGTVLLPGAIGYVLLFAVYANLIGSYVVRRQELVLKRLRTGEARDAEILVSGALPTVAIGLVQCALLLVGGAVLLELAPPEDPELVVVGVLLGMALMVALAAVSSAITSTAESAQLTPMPLMMVSFIGSGMLLPLEVLPDRVAMVCQWLPLTPVMELVRGGWTGGLEGVDALRAVGIAVVWTALAVFAVRRWFRWEPRR